MDKKLLVVYASRYGQTEKIARRIAEIAHGEAIAVNDVTDAALAEASDVIVAGGVYFGRHDRALSRFVRRNGGTLAKLHTGFVSVCGDAGPGGDLKRAQSRIEKFQRENGWTPDVSGAFAGGLAFTRYGWFIGFVMRKTAAARGITDTSRDYEYTDWIAVDAFARQFAADARLRAA